MPYNNDRLMRALVSLVIYDIGIHYHHRQVIKDLRARHADALRILKTKEAQVDFLCDLINRNKIEMTEFDKIALTDLNFTIK